jgi:hypothetical protein
VSAQYDDDQTPAGGEALSGPHPEQTAPPVGQQHTAESDAGDFAWAEMLTHQECAAKKHPDWFIDSEHNLLCPWCEIDRLRARLRAVDDFVDDMAPTYSTGEQAGNALRVLNRLIDEATSVTPPGGGRA